MSEEKSNLKDLKLKITKTVIMEHMYLSFSKKLHFAQVQKQKTKTRTRTKTKTKTEYLIQSSFDNMQ